MCNKKNSAKGEGRVSTPCAAGFILVDGVPMPILGSRSPVLRMAFDTSDVRRRIAFAQ